MRQCILAMCAVILTLSTALAEPEATPKVKPLMKDFIGLNGHFHFKPELYRPVTRLVRNYHDINWDVVKPGDPITFPICANKVNWDTHVYGKWAKHGFEVDLCAQFGRFSEENKDYKELWRGQEDWIYKYGYEMAAYFGPSGDKKLVTSIEIGNEPGNDFDDTLYQTLFIHMAKGIRAADPKIKIVTATAHSGPANKYGKSLEETFSSPEILALYDVINVHTYATKPKKEGQSPWDRSYPEDPTLDYLKVVDAAITFRDTSAPGKELWITEFGYDSCTPEAMKSREGWFEKLNWQGVTDTQQAQYTVRSLFCFAERDVERAYIYFFNDSDKASVHAASGLTRDFEPKPAYWAVKHLYETLGDYRLNKVVVKKEESLYLYEFTHGSENGRVIWVAWSPTGVGREQEITLRSIPGTIRGAERMPLTDTDPATIAYTQPTATSIRFTANESPVYIMFDAPK